MQNGEERVKGPSFSCEAVNRFTCEDSKKRKFSSQELYKKFFVSSYFNLFTERTITEPSVLSSPEDPSPSHDMTPVQFLKQLPLKISLKL